MFKASQGHAGQPPPAPATAICLI